MKRKSLYIETKINGEFDTLWEYTQNPEKHQLWDLRFTEIKYLAKDNPFEPQKFLYSKNICFGLKINGIGESVATKTKDNGESTSVLKFSSGSRLSIIKQGSGYWKYVPETDGIKFFTGYDYETRWGFFGEVLDKFIFRLLIIWATAWSFDCLKNWIEKGNHPKQVIKAQITVLLIHITLSLVWIYQGLVPKLLFSDAGEIEILKQSGLFIGFEKSILTFIGLAEILFGLIFLYFHNKTIHFINVFLLLLLSAGAIFSSAVIYTLPFNPFSLNISLIALSIIAIINLDFLPNASKCKTKQKT